MKEKNNSNLPKEVMQEDATKYGEFVCSAYHWISLEDQKKEATRLENLTKKTTKQKEKMRYQKKKR